MNPVTKTKEQLLTELQKSRAKAIQTIQTFRTDLEALLMQLEKASIEEVEAEYIALKTRVNNERQNDNEHIITTEQANKQFDNTAENGAHKTGCVGECPKKITNSSEQADHTPATALTSVNICYNINPDINRFLKELRSFGHTELLSSCQDNPNPTILTKQIVYTLRATTDVNVKMADDNCELYIPGCFYTSDDYLLLTDFYNKKFKRVDVCKQCIQDHCDMPEGPLAVTCTDSREAAVSLLNNTVQLVSLGDKMTLSRKLKFGHVCYGLAYSDGQLFISDNDQHVFVYDLEGNPIRTITSSPTETCQLLAFDSKTERLYIAAWTCLQAYDRHGNHVLTFTDPNIQNIRSVCTDGRGSVFVCGEFSERVIQMTKDGEKVGEIPVLRECDGIETLLSACFSPRYGKLFFTFPTDLIKVLELMESEK